ncbi:methylenetetrahydrofolate reductase [NAD(P)H] [Halioglobus japonicus]|uniref:Methylenetetrahydrofolate reductase n=1 Tax=Halioglobus japonicus TaxID=930805 RepID=A0AAP8MCR0_9GAMM|nr:methylenetetrahydrofolate reductase [NAD(P)H] [Halioglobus japonicus]AQA17431.1 methylenetetrahydrofolate reductase [NAD(P)H] [Halioglobus japonicus]PLW85356.1 methylenetetrahydrofolate reductase [NAD(P)H] [Halioglobus japonicus]GHD22160.1 methylenetetrahydrofolate reductase [Halioglobus japonicus]
MAKPRISFEYFPPKTDAGKDKLLNETTPALNELNPEFFSVTYGAGGTTRDTTLGVVSTMREAGVDVAPHISFGGDDEDTMAELLQTYKARGIKRLVALRGDMPSGMGTAMQLVHANDLVAFIREKTGDHFNIEVAAYPEIHPESKSYDSDIHFLKKKMDAGANSAITQYFYNVEAYFYYLDQCMAAGIDKPIYAGIMPITNFENLARFSRNCGAEIPRWICRKMEGYGDDLESVRKFGLEVVTQLCQTLMDSGCPGIHFYTMNQVEPTREIYNNLGL